MEWRTKAAKTKRRQKENNKKRRDKINKPRRTELRQRNNRQTSYKVQSLWSCNTQNDNDDDDNDDDDDDDDEDDDNHNDDDNDDDDDAATHNNFLYLPFSFQARVSPPSSPPITLTATVARPSSHRLAVTPMP